MAPAWQEFGFHLKQKIMIIMIMLMIIIIEGEGREGEGEGEEIGRQEKDLEPNVRGTWCTKVKLCFFLSLFILHHFY